MISVYALVFVTELCQAAIFPLLPTLGRELELSGLQTGAILAATTVATVIAAVPIGMLADRLGARRLTVAAGIGVTGSALVQAFAGSFWILVAGRALYGLAFATVWTAGVTLVSGASRPGRGRAVGGTIVVGGAAHLVGPSMSGLLAEHVSTAMPFLVVSAAALLVTLLLARTRVDRVDTRPREPLDAVLRAVRGHHELRTALVLMALVGTAAGIVPLLAPLVLDENGLSPAQIGGVFSAASAAWIVVSALVARAGRRAVRVPAAGVGALALGAVFLLPVATLASAAVAAFLVLRAVAQAPLSTICYPLTEAGARIAGLGAGTAIGLANVVWGAAAALGPLAGGALVGALGARATFALVALAGGAAGAFILLGRGSSATNAAAETA